MHDADLRAEASASGPGHAPGIGRPLDNVRTYVLDTWGNPAPEGVPGELFIGGAQVARGYLHRPALTAERFVPDPFGDRPGARLYRSGDRVRWLPDGTLEYLGRMDEQLSIRGVRVEPGEVEAVLREHPGVGDVVVADYEHAPGDRRLAAYVVPRAPAVVGDARSPAGGGDALTAEVRRFARASLPAHMVPAAFIPIDRVPLTPNGKVDRRALPAPAEGGLPAPSAPPRAGLEERVAAVWREVLGVERVGREDGFFDLGGHSLLLGRLGARLEEALGREISLPDLVRHPTVAAFTEYLQAGDAGALPEEGLRRAAVRRAMAGRRNPHTTGAGE